MAIFLQTFVRDQGISLYLYYDMLNRYLNTFSTVCLLVGLSCLALFPAQAQDVHFSQFYLSPLTTNPANTGHFDGDWRIAANHRNQWRSLGNPYTTTSLSYDQNVFVYSEQMAFGLLYLHDESGTVGLKFDKIMLSGAYHKQLGRHKLRLGIQPGVVIKAVNLNGVSLPEQYDRSTGTFNSSLPSSEPAYQDQLTYFDFNAGISYSVNLGTFRPEAGLSFFHINQPNESFYAQTNKLPMRAMLTIRADIDLGKKLVFTPNYLHMIHQKASEILVGANVMVRLNDNKIKASGIYGGMLFRNGINRNTDAAIAVVGMKFKHLEVGFNYDFTVSDLQAANNSQGAYEISIVYTSLSTLLQKTTVPCERY
ncbi:PorP/SprF family type IX secretion system membrane protein [bacterium SCSIO 12741]|nr:PorP/SprF family type IX secretion system membrane protein [bacterium SCSIO 12741]